MAIKIPQTVLPDSHSYPKDKITNMIWKGKLYDGYEDYISTGNELEVYVTFTDKNEVTLYEAAVHDAICALYINGDNKFISLPMIYKAMTGDKKARLSEESANRIRESVIVLSETHIDIDASQEAEEANSRKWNFEFEEFNDCLIDIEFVKGVRDGVESEWVKILNLPILHEYAQFKKQIATVPAQLKNTPIRKNKEIIELQTYLLKRVEAMKNSKKVNNTIRFTKSKGTEGLYEVLMLEAPTIATLRKKQQRIRDYTIQILDYWKTEGWIKGYTTNKTRRTIDSLTIKI